MNSNDKQPEKEYEFCLRCGRKLRKPETRRVGYGVICFKKMKASSQYKKLF